jgi:hypothetical protein
MTIPVERTRAVLAAHEFLFDLLDPQKTPRVPLVIRHRASLVLRHYPFLLDLWWAHKRCPKIWGPPE